MSEEIKKSVERIREALNKLPPVAAEKVAENAAMRAEAVADYLDSVSRKETA